MGGGVFYTHFVILLPVSINTSFLVVLSVHCLFFGYLLERTTSDVIVLWQQSLKEGNIVKLENEVTKQHDTKASTFLVKTRTKKDF